MRRVATPPWARRHASCRDNAVGAKHLRPWSAAEPIYNGRDKTRRIRSMAANASPRRNATKRDETRRNAAKCGDHTERDETRRIAILYPRSSILN
jgi:hypothetical protein